jgi:hypothetical protein
VDGAVGVDEGNHFLNGRSISDWEKYRCDLQLCLGAHPHDIRNLVPDRWAWLDG